MKIEPRPNTIYLVNVKYPYDHKSDYWITWFNGIDTGNNLWKTKKDFNIKHQRHYSVPNFLTNIKNIEIIMKIKHNPTVQDWKRIIKDPKYRLLAVI